MDPLSADQWLEVISRELGVPWKTLTLATRPFKELELDSVEVYGLIALFDELGVVVSPDEAFARVPTLGELYTAYVAHMGTS